MLESESSTTSVGDLGSPNANGKKQEKRKEETRDNIDDETEDGCCLDTLKINDRDCCNVLLNNRASSGNVNNGGLEIFPQENNEENALHANDTH